MVVALNRDALDHGPRDIRRSACPGRSSRHTGLAAQTGHRDSRWGSSPSDPRRRRLPRKGYRLIAAVTAAPDAAAAHRLYLKGRYYWNRRTVADMCASVALFEQAIERDPGRLPHQADLQGPAAGPRAPPSGSPARPTRLEDLVAEKMSEVKVLSGLLPIGARCKKIRDDEGYWGQVEVCIHKHFGPSSATASAPTAWSRSMPSVPSQGRRSRPCADLSARRAGVILA